MPSAKLGADRAAPSACAAPSIALAIAYCPIDWTAFKRFELVSHVPPLTGQFTESVCGQTIRHAICNQLAPLGLGPHFIGSQHDGQCLTEHQVPKTALGAPFKAISRQYATLWANSHFPSEPRIA